MTDTIILEVGDVTVNFDGFKALNGLEFTLRRGELHFLIGPNGAGKTTLLDVLSGKVRPDSGRIRFEGIDLTRRREHEIVRLGISRKFQTPSVFHSLTVQENLDLAASYRRVLALFRPLDRGTLDLIDATLAGVGLDGLRHERAGHLSHGQKQWLEIAMLLVQEPKLLLLDEPVAGMSREERVRTGEILQTIARDRTVLVVEHDMTFIRRFARSVTVMHEGRVLTHGTIEQVQRNPRVVEVYLGRGQDTGAPADWGAPAC